MQFENQSRYQFCIHDISLVAKEKRLVSQNRADLWCQYSKLLTLFYALSRTRHFLFLGLDFRRTSVAASERSHQTQFSHITTVPKFRSNSCNIKFVGMFELGWRNLRWIPRPRVGNFLVLMGTGQKIFLAIIRQNRYRIPTKFSIMPSRHCRPMT